MTEQDPAPKPTKLTYAAFAVVAVLVVCMVVAAAVALTSGNDSDPVDTPPTATVPEHPSDGPKAPDSSDEAMEGLAAPTVDRLGRRVDVPKFPGGWALPQDGHSRPYNPTVPVTAPAGMMWQRVNDGAIVPFSTSDGPEYVNGLRAIGYAQTPQGAAVAAWQIAMRVGASNNETARKIYDDQVVMNSSQRRELYAQLDAEGPYHRGASDELLSYQTKADAFRVLEYADDLAVIEYASVAPKADDGTDQWLTTRLIASWEDGDWKLALPEHLGDPTGTATTLDGWTTW